MLSALIAPALGIGMAAVPVPKSKYSVRYFGQIRGLAVIGEYKHEREGASLLGNAGEKKILMILSEDGNEITVFEGADSKEPAIHVLTCISCLKPPYREE